MAWDERDAVATRSDAADRRAGMVCGRARAAVEASPSTPRRNQLLMMKTLHLTRRCLLVTVGETLKMNTVSYQSRNFF